MPKRHFWRVCKGALSLLGMVQTCGAGCGHMRGQWGSSSKYQYRIY